jgi:hypothetical protein
MTNTLWRKMDTTQKIGFAFLTIGLVMLILLFRGVA